MFTNKRYLTRGIQEKIPFELQMFLWCCIDNLQGEKDYFQVFDLHSIDGMQRVHHFSERPEYTMEYLLTIVEHPINAKIYVIDDGEHSTMLLAEEY